MNLALKCDNCQTHNNIQTFNESENICLCNACCVDNFSKIYNVEFYPGNQMDKQINKVKKNLDNAEKDTKKLLKMDKKFDKKLEKCDDMKKMKKKK